MRNKSKKEDTHTHTHIHNDSIGKESTYNAEDKNLICGWEDPLEKEMATHSSILVWRIPWTEEPGRLQSMGLQRVVCVIAITTMANSPCCAVETNT